jgi:acyl-[acyl-carrier-protein]-phospholipid O-acyltransferase/long-chain-fatty-acid--[acyl-carrier-protein] ligase
MFRTLMTSRRFAPLFWCQFLSAFNDNFIRNMLAMLILFGFGAENASLKILLATIVFMLPAIPLSALGGEIFLPAFGPTMSQRRSPFPTRDAASA